MSLLRAPVRPSGWSTNPKSLIRHAEQVVIERARELLKKGDARINHADLREWDSLKESVRVLDVIEGKTPT